VSQWVTALKLCDRYLSENNIRFVHYTGEMSKIKREESVDAFMRNKKCMVMLLSQKAGGVGLNLVRGNHLLNLDLAWSPAVDNQVFARLHRIGQTREVYIKRFISELPA
jgi:SNF2 family DNA or RNA helicase